MIEGDEFEFTVGNTSRRGRHVDVFVDGVKVERCTYANTRTGEVRRYATDEDGNLVVDRNELRIEALRGAVRVEERPK